MTLAIIRDIEDYNWTRNEGVDMAKLRGKQKWKHCYRYSAATQMLLDADEEYTLPLFWSILDATHQVGIPPTLLSAIYDLKTRSITLYNFYNYDEAVVLDVDTLLQNGSGKYDIPEYFSHMRLPLAPW